MHKIIYENNKMEQVNIFKQTKQVNRKVQLKFPSKSKIECNQIHLLT